MVFFSQHLIFKNLKLEQVLSLISHSCPNFPYTVFLLTALYLYFLVGPFRLQDCKLLTCLCILEPRTVSGCSKNLIDFWWIDTILTLKEKKRGHESNDAWEIYTWGFLWRPGYLHTKVQVWHLRPFRTQSIWICPQISLQIRDGIIIMVTGICMVLLCLSYWFSFFYFSFFLSYKVFKIQCVLYLQNISIWKLHFHGKYLIYT